MTSFEETILPCGTCGKTMKYFGMPKSYFLFKHIIFPICNRCGEKLFKDARKIIKKDRDIKSWIA